MSLHIEKLSLCVSNLARIAQLKSLLLSLDLCTSNSFRRGAYNSLRLCISWILFSTAQTIWVHRVSRVSLGKWHFLSDLTVQMKLVPTIVIRAIGTQPQVLQTGHVDAAQHLHGLDAVHADEQLPQVREADVFDVHQHLLPLVELYDKDCQ